MASGRFEADRAIAAVAGVVDTYLFTVVRGGQTVREVQILGMATEVDRGPRVTGETEQEADGYLDGEQHLWCALRQFGFDAAVPGVMELDGVLARSTTL